MGSVILLAGLALLIIASGIGLFSVIHANQVASSNANATATTQANSTATIVAANATGIAEANAIATQNATNATATATVYQNLYNQSTSGTPALSDPLSDNSNGNGWNVGTNNSGGSCQFAGGAYHISQTRTNYFWSCTTSGNFSDFAYQVQMQIIKGDDGGVAFRVNITNNTFYGYVFAVGQNGSYQLFVCPPNTTSCNSLSSSSSSAINQGLNQTNLVTVIVKGNTITLYVNQQEIESMTDSTFSHGQIGVIAEDNSNATEVVYSNAKVWRL